MGDQKWHHGEEERLQVDEVGLLHKQLYCAEQDKENYKNGALLVKAF